MNFGGSNPGNMKGINQMREKFILATRLETIDWRIIIAMIFLTVSVLAGQFSLSRLVPWFSEDLARVRNIALAAAFISLWPEIFKNWRLVIAPPFLAFCALCGYLLFRGLFDHGPNAALKTVDIMIMLAQGGLLMIAGGNETARRTIAIFIIVVASILLLMEIYGQLTYFTGKPAPAGFGRKSLIGPISFTRIEFLAFCVILCALSTMRIGFEWRFLSLIFLAVLFLFATWGSLQKASLVASIIVLSGLIIAYWFQGSWRMLVLLCIVMGLTFELTSTLFGNQISKRIDYAGRTYEKPAVSPTIPHAPPPSALMPGPHHERSKAKLSIRYCYYKSAIEQKLIKNATISCFDRSMVDGTSRIPLAIEAIRGLAVRPIFGHGLATFLVEFIHTLEMKPDPYVYPHNLFLEVAFEGGGVGLILLILALVIMITWALRAPIPPTMLLPLMCYVGYLLLSSLASGDFYDSRLLWLPLFLVYSWGQAASSSQYHSQEETRRLAGAD